jgi:hypothetical protein
MSLSDCSSCWQTPCVCGSKYDGSLIGKSIIGCAPRVTELGISTPHHRHTFLPAYSLGVCPELVFILNNTFILQELSDEGIAPYVFVNKDQLISFFKGPPVAVLTNDVDEIELINRFILKLEEAPVALIIRTFNGSIYIDVKLASEPYFTNKTMLIVSLQNIGRHYGPLK